MRIIINENQYKKLISNPIDEVIDSYDDEDSEENIINKTKDNLTWMDYRDKSLKNYPEDIIQKALKDTVDYYKNNYSVKRVVVKDDENVVGYLLFSTTTEKKETISNDDTKQYNIILSTAIHPKYRGKGLLKMMINKSQIKRPFIVHTSSLSTPEVWEKIGCKPVKDLNYNNNKIQLCY